jgi:hypothetical protein
MYSFSDWKDLSIRPTIGLRLWAEEDGERYVSLSAEARGETSEVRNIVRDLGPAESAVIPTTGTPSRSFYLSATGPVEVDFGPYVFDDVTTLLLEFSGASGVSVTNNGADPVTVTILSMKEE